MALDKKHRDRLLARLKSLDKDLDVVKLSEAIRAGDRVAMSRAITLTESNLASDKKKASALIDLLLPHSGKAVRIGITGVPGVGKSSFIEAFGTQLLQEGSKLAVLAIDPASARNGGSILGDKTRMETLSTNADVYIRPSSSGGTLGGIAEGTRQAIIICEAAGYDYVVVETVGVGQSEITVDRLTDMFVLLMLAGAGDDLQGIKRGIMEMTDLMLITKADGDNVKNAKQARNQYAGALHMMQPRYSKWYPKVMTVSSSDGLGLDDVRKEISSFVNLQRSSGEFDEKRHNQNAYWFEERLRELSLEKIISLKKDIYIELKSKVEAGDMDGFSAANILIESF